MNNIEILLLISMIFCHIIDDFYLQGILADLKQKEWWQKNAPDKMYKYDYFISLIIHAISWSIMICLPLIIYTMLNNIDGGMNYIAVAIVINIFIHSFIDNAKANLHIINLWLDQTVHFLQVWITYLFFLLTYIK